MPVNISMQYTERDIKSRVKELIKSFLVIILTGPCQSGKTTFPKHNFPIYKYFKSVIFVYEIMQNCILT